MADRREQNPEHLDLQMVLNAIPQRLFWKDRDFTYLGCNQLFAEDAGLSSPQEVIGRTDFELKWKASAHIYRADDADVIENGTMKLNYEEPLVRPDGTELWLRTSKVPLRNHDGEIIGVFGTYEDITEYRRAREELSRSEERYRTLVEQASDGILLTTDDGLILDANAAIEKLLGYTREELLSKRFADLVEPAALAANPPMYDRLRTGITVTNERLLMRSDSTTVPVEVSARQLPDGSLLGFIRDISERNAAQRRERALEAQLRQSQKMEALGTLAGGVAHDFNNILLAITGYTELVSETFDEDDPTRADLQQVLRAADRGRQLVDRILAFSRPAGEEPHPVWPEVVLSEVLPLLGSSLPRKIDVHTRIAASDRVVMADEALINQILLNLVTNAAHAMPGGGRLEVTLDEREFDHPTAHMHGELSPGRYFVLSVADSGHGIAPELLDRVFEPFFTTKDVGRGSGLGLAIVHGIASSLGGAVAVSSKTNEGTIFRVYLPSRDAPEAGRNGEEGEMAAGGGRILLVDDEPQLVAIGERMLRRHGYDVVTFTDPHEAIAAFEADPGHFDAIVTDVTMPGLDGTDLSRRAREARSDLPIVLVTGYRDHTTQDAMATRGLGTVLMKPYVGADLVRAVGRALGRAAGRKPDTENG
jgi:PAS domain S-box-containing protein